MEYSQRTTGSGRMTKANMGMIAKKAGLGWFPTLQLRLKAWKDASTYRKKSEQ